VFGKRGVAVDEVQRSIQEQSRAVSELAPAEIETKELDGDKKTSLVISSYSETVINPMPGDA
jgi:hypothetical protein